MTILIDITDYLGSPSTDAMALHEWLKACDGYVILQDEKKMQRYVEYDPSWQPLVSKHYSCAAKYPNFLMTSHGDTFKWRFILWRNPNTNYIRYGLEFAEATQASMYLMTHGGEVICNDNSN